MRQCWFCYGDNNSGMGDACSACLRGFQEREDHKKALYAGVGVHGDTQGNVAGAILRGHSIPLNAKRNRSRFESGTPATNSVEQELARQAESGGAR